MYYLSNSQRQHLWAQIEKKAKELDLPKRFITDLDVDKRALLESDDDIPSYGIYGLSEDGTYFYHLKSDSTYHTNELIAVVNSVQESKEIVYWFYWKGDSYLQAISFHRLISWLCNIGRA